MPKAKKKKKASVPAGMHPSLFNMPTLTHELIRMMNVKPPKSKKKKKK